MVEACSSVSSCRLDVTMSIHDRSGLHMHNDL